jgi:hypothetical protein
LTTCKARGCFDKLTLERSVDLKTDRREFIKAAGAAVAAAGVVDSSRVATGDSSSPYQSQARPVQRSNW